MVELDAEVRAEFKKTDDQSETACRQAMIMAPWPTKRRRACCQIGGNPWLFPIPGTSALGCTGMLKNTQKTRDVRPQDCDTRGVLHDC